MAYYRPGSHAIRRYHDRHSLPNSSATSRTDCPGPDGIGRYVAQGLFSAICERAHKPAKLILNFGHLQHMQQAPDESSDTIIYNAPGGVITVHENLPRLMSEPARKLGPTRHHPSFRGRRPSPVPAIVDGIEEGDFDPHYFRSPSPDIPADPVPGIRYVRPHHSPRPVPIRQAPVSRRSLRPVVYNQVLDDPPQVRRAIETAIQERLLHSHAHPHARFCRGCRHRHRKINSDGYCLECVYFLQSAPLPHRKVAETISPPRVRPLPSSDKIMERIDRTAEMKRLRRAALERTERAVAREQLPRTNRRPERRRADLARGGIDNTSVEYEYVGARRRYFGREDDGSELDDWERL